MRRAGTCFQLSSSSSSLVPYDICRPDHSVLSLQLPVTASVREVMAALAHEDHWTKGQVLVKVNSAGGELCLWMDSLPWEGTLRPTPAPLNLDHCVHAPNLRQDDCISGCFRSNGQGPAGWFSH